MLDDNDKDDEADDDRFYHFTMQAPRQRKQQDIFLSEKTYRNVSKKKKKERKKRSGTGRDRKGREEGCRTRQLGNNLN